VYAISLASVELAGSGAPRLRLLGRQLSELGRLAWPEFQHLLLRRTWQAGSADLRLVQSQMAAADPASPWARDAKRFLEASWAGLTDVDVLIPEALRRNRSPDEARALMQRQIRRFGELLEGWPEIFNAARRLGDRGVTLGRRL
jgi:hypothetical protein